MPLQSKYKVSSKYRILLSNIYWCTGRNVHGYRIRFKGQPFSYTDQELDGWIAFIQEACQQCTDVYVYFNNDPGAVAIDNARTMLQKLHKLGHA